MADSAKGMLTLAWVQFLVGGLTLFIVFLTYRLTRKTAERQLRAYVSAEVLNGRVGYATAVDERGLVTKGSGFTVTLVLRNRGQTPAHNLTYWVRFEVSAFPRPGLNYKPPDEYVANIVLHPDGERTRPQAVVLTEAERLAIESGREMRLYLWGVVAYYDAFNVRRETRFRLMYGGDESVQRDTMWWCDEGNEAT